MATGAVVISASKHFPVPKIDIAQWSGRLSPAEIEQIERKGTVGKPNFEAMLVTTNRDICENELTKLRTSFDESQGYPAWRVLVWEGPAKLCKHIWDCTGTNISEISG